MNHEELLRHARRQRTVTRALTERGDLSAARSLLTALIATIERFMAATADDSAARIDPTARVELARELLDTYGNLGGVEWRAGNLREAWQAYEQGRKIEEDDRYGIEESYNLTNSIVLFLMLHPDRIERVRKDLARAAQLVRCQVEGRRRDQWWAWADYGLLSSLLGDRETADVAYESFHECGPGRSDALSVRRVLTSVAEAVEPRLRTTAEYLKQEAAYIEGQITGG